MPPLTQEWFDLLLALFRRITRRERGMKGYGILSIPQVVLLDALQHRDRHKMRELAEILGVGMSAATGLVDRLVKAGLVIRSRDLEDRRVVWVSITPKGRLLFRRFRQARQKTFKSMLKNLSRREQSLFLTLFRRMGQGLETRTPG